MIRLLPFPCPHWTAFILVYLGPNQSSQQLFTTLLSNDGAREGRKMLLSSFLYIYIFEQFGFVSKISIHNGTYVCLTACTECTADPLNNTEGVQKLDIQLSACIALVTLFRKVSETHTGAASKFAYFMLLYLCPKSMYSFCEEKLHTIDYVAK